MKTENVQSNKSRSLRIAAALANRYPFRKLAGFSISSFFSKGIMLLLLLCTFNVAKGAEDYNIGGYWVSVYRDKDNNVSKVVLNGRINAYAGAWPAVINDLPTHVDTEGPYGVLPITNIAGGFIGYGGALRVNIEKIVIPEGYVELEGGSNSFSACPKLTSVSLPSTLKVIGGSVFSNNPLLTSITFPEGIDNIMNAAFGSTGLTSVTIPQSLRLLGGNSFTDCPNLTTVNFNAVNCTGSGSGTFKNSPVTVLNVGSSVRCLPALGMTSLITANLPNSLEVIGYAAFAGYTNLTNITIPSSVRIIEDRAFYKSGLTSIVVPEGCDSISSAFSECMNLTNATINARYIDYIFYGCTNLVEVTINSDIIGNNSCYNCTNLKKATLNARYLGRNSFGGCTNLEKVTLSQTETIGEFAFSGCASLTSIEIPGSVTSIDSYAFADNTSLRQIKVNWKTPFTLVNADQIFSNLDSRNITIIVPRGTKSLYQAADIWRYFPIIEDNEPFAAAGNNNAVISWYPEEQATGYQIDVYTDEDLTELSGTYMIDASGAAQSTKSGSMSYNVTGLSANTTYYYTLTVLVDENTIAIYNETFATNNGSGISQTQVSEGLQMYIHNGELRIENIESDKNNGIMLFDITGKMLLSDVVLSANHSINVSYLPAGIYIVKVGNRTGKFVKR